MSTTPPMDQQPQVQLSSVPRNSAISLSSEIMVAAIIFFFVVVVFVVFLHIYAKMRWRRTSSASRRSRLVFAAYQDPSVLARRGLDPSVVNALPLAVYRAEDFKASGGIECAVCLSELAEGEKVRILPKCGHGFHLDCIDMWFHSHSTCPLCRRPVGPDGDAVETGAAAEPTPQEEMDVAAETTGSPNLPANVLFWRTQNAATVSTRAQLEAGASAPTAAAAAPSSSSPGKLDGALVIDIPRHAAEFSFSSPHSPLPPSRFPVEDLKSPAAAAPTAPITRLRSFRRILSREKRMVGPSSSPRGVNDVEQGLGGADAGGCQGDAPKDAHQFKREP